MGATAAALTIAAATLLSSSDAALAAQQDSEEREGFRLLEFGVGDRRWATSDEVNEFAVAGLNFFDVTNHQNDFHEISNHGLAQQEKVAYGYPIAAHYRSQSLALFDLIEVGNINATIVGLSTFHNRYYTTSFGVESSEWLANQYQQVIDASGRSDARVSLYSHSEWDQPSIIAKILGSSSNKEVIIFGGHIDSIAPNMPTGRAPGADDDASGCAVVLEIFRILLDSGFIPMKTIEFHGYAAEEVGLRGSQDIAGAYADDGVDVIGMMNFDMTIFPDRNPGINFITDYVDSSLTSFNEVLCNEYAIPYTTSQCGYACSDHASFYRNGMPSSHPWEAMQSNRKIHTSDDTLAIDGVDVSHSIIFTKLGIATAIELGSILCPGNSLSNCVSKCPIEGLEECVKECEILC